MLRGNRHFSINRIVSNEIRISVALLKNKTAYFRIYLERFMHFGEHRLWHRKRGETIPINCSGRPFVGSNNVESNRCTAVTRRFTLVIFMRECFAKHAPPCPVQAQPIKRPRRTDHPFIFERSRQSRTEADRQSDID